MQPKVLIQSVRSSVLIALGFSLFCSAFYVWGWLQMGHGSWTHLLEGSANIAGPTEIFALAINLYIRWPDGKMFKF